MKLIVQIPCLNEEETLPITIRNIPREIPGIDKVEILIIDDGCTDCTVYVARELGVEHIVHFRRNRGLAAAFSAGIDACLRLGADIIVNTDGDNQYAGSDIPKLIAPILEGKADVVIGDRQTDSIPHFSPLKKRLQRAGSWVVRRVSDTKVNDATSGFRAYSREAALHLNVISSYTYTLETIIHAGKQRMAIANVGIHTNPMLRKSRLFSRLYQYLYRSIATIMRIYAMYDPMRVFLFLGSILLLGGLALSFRYIYFMFQGPEEATGHIQSVMLAAVLLIAGFQILLIGLVADLISINRQLAEDILLRVKRLELTKASGGNSGQDK